MPSAAEATDARPLLSERGRATSRDTKTVQVYSFDLPLGAEAVSLRFDYSPRVSNDRDANARLLEAAFELHTRRRRATMSGEELARHRAALNVDRRADALDNLMNVVLIDAEGKWRGRWDRNPSSASGALLLGTTHASRGFIAGRLPAGRWSVAIECHGIFRDDIEFEVSVSTRSAPTDEEIAALRDPASGSRAVAAPKRRGPGWYVGEMHSHSVHSDGKWELEELAARVSARSAEFLCLTDHNTVSGLVDAPDLPVTLIPGIELTTFYGHHPMYGVTSMIPWHVDGRVLPLSETSKNARALGAIVGVAHPFVPGDPLCTGCRMIEGLDPSSFDLMEVWYRRWDSPGSDNEAAYALWNRYWAEGHRVTAVAARDLHRDEQDGPFPGDLPLSAVFAEDNTPAAILEGIRRGRVVMTAGPIVDLRLAERELVVELSRVDEPATLRVFRSGAVAYEVDVDRDAVLSFDAPEDGYYRAELWAAASPRAITNHVVRE